MNTNNLFYLLFRNLPFRIALIILALPFAINIFHTAGLIEKALSVNSINVIKGLGILTLMFSLVFLLLKDNRIISLSERAFIFIIVLFGSIVGLVSIFYFENSLYSDYKTYYEYSVRFLNNDIQFDSVNYIRFKRCFFYTIPIFYIFGYENLIWLEICNLIVLILTGLIFYYIFKLQSISRKIRRIALIFYFLFPTGYLYLNLTSHDISGAFYLAIYLLLVIIILRNRLNFEFKNILRVISYSILSGFLIFVNEWQRSLGIFILSTLIIFFIVYLFKIAKGSDIKTKIKILSLRFLLIALIPISFYLILDKNIYSFENSYYDLKNVLFSYNFSEKDDYSPNDIITSRASSYGQFNSDEEALNNTLKKTGSDLYYNYKGFIEVISSKSKKLLSYGDAVGWVTNKMHDDLPWDLDKTEILKTIIFLYRIILYSLIIVGAGFFIRHSFNNTERYINFLFPVIFIYILLVGEVQPRYLHLAGPFLYLAAGYGLYRISAYLNILKKGRTIRKENEHFISLGLFRYTVLLLILFFGLGLFVKSFVLFTGYRYVDLSKPKLFAYIDIDKTQKMQVKSDYNSIKLLLPPFEIKGSSVANFDLNTHKDGYYNITGFFRRPAKIVNAEAIISLNNYKVKEYDLADTVEGVLSGDSLEKISFFRIDSFYCNSDSTKLSFILTSSGTHQGTINAGLEYISVNKLFGTTSVGKNFPELDSSSFRLNCENIMNLNSFEDIYCLPEILTREILHVAPGEMILIPTKKIPDDVYIGIGKKYQIEEKGYLPSKLKSNSQYVLLVKGQNLKETRLRVDLIEEKDRITKKLVFRAKRDTLGLFGFNIPENILNYRIGFMPDSAFRDSIVINNIRLSKIY